MDTTLHLRATPQQVKDATRAAVAAATGAGPDSGGNGRALALAVGMECLSIIKTAFIAKSNGGADEAGETWEPLSPKTIAARRPPSPKKKGERPRGLLNSAQDARWRALFAAALKWMKGDKGHAAAYAWTILKAEGAKTRLETLGNRQVSVGRDTGRLFNSLSPGVEDNVLQAAPGAVTVGTAVKYAARFHAKRRLWPDQSKWPSSWWARLNKTAADGLLYMIEEQLKQLPK